MAGGWSSARSCPSPHQAVSVPSLPCPSFPPSPSPAVPGSWRDEHPALPGPGWGHRPGDVLGPALPPPPLQPQAVPGLTSCSMHTTHSDFFSSHCSGGAVGPAGSCGGALGSGAAGTSVSSSLRSSATTAGSEPPERCPWPSPALPALPACPPHTPRVYLTHRALCPRLRCLLRV